MSDMFFKRRGNGVLPLGAVVTFADAAVTEVLAAAGFDFIWIDGDDCWAMVQDCLLTPFGDIQKAEVHADFIDIQMPLDGPETYGLYTSDLEAFGPFDKCRDIGFADVRTQPLTLRYGEFAIFFPGSGAHAPCKTLGPKTMRKKLVIKVRK